MLNQYHFLYSFLFPSLVTVLFIILWNYSIKSLFNYYKINKLLLFKESLILWILFLIIFSIIYTVDIYNSLLAGLISVTIIVLPYFFIFFKKQFYKNKWYYLWIYYNLIEFIYLLILIFIISVCFFILSDLF